MSSLIRRAIVGPSPNSGERAGHIEERLVDRDRLDLRRVAAEDRHHVTAGRLVTPAVDRQEHRVRTAPVRLAQRHRRVDPEDARLVARGRDHAAGVLAPATPDDDRPAAELRPVALLDGGEEGIEIDVQDRSRGHRRYHRPAVEPPARIGGAEPVTPDAAEPSPPALDAGRLAGRHRSWLNLAILAAIGAGALVAWALPLSAVVLVWPILFFVPGWVVIRRVVPNLGNPGAVGAAIVTSTYVSAHLVNVVARVGGFGREAIIVSAVLLAVATLVVAQLRHRWLHARSAGRPATTSSSPSGTTGSPGTWPSRSASSCSSILMTNGWHETPNGWVSGGWNWSDFLVHVSIGASIAAGNFPPQVPYFAGEPLTYHWFADFDGAITSTVVGHRPHPGLLPVERRLRRRPRPRDLGPVDPADEQPSGRRHRDRARLLRWRDGLDPADRRPDRRRRQRRRPGQPHLVRQHLDRRLAVVQDRLDLRDRVPAAPRDDLRAARARDRRAADRGLPRPPAAGRAAGRHPGRPARAVPVLRLPGDLPDRVPVRRDDRRVARPDRRPRRDPVPGADRACGAVHRRGDRPAARHRGIPIRAGLERGPLRATGRSRSASST